MVRIVKIYSTLGTSGTIETNVTTLGQLKPLLEDRGINFSGMKMLIGETKNEISMDDAVLPEGNFKIFLMPEKTKSGNSELATLFNRLASICEDIASQFENGAVMAASVSDNVAGEQVSISLEDKAAFDELKALQAKNDW